MRVLIINTSERIGGAAIAANRLMEALKNNGIKAKMLVRDKQTNQVTVVALRKSWLHIWKFVWERFIIWKANRFNKHNLFAVDIANTGTDITTLPEFRQADVVHLHWINQGMLSLKNIQRIINSQKPIVWTMHDMWPVTGICHHADTCTNYQTQCHDCQLLTNSSKHDLSYQIFRKKQLLYKNANITFIACSKWLEGLAQKSILTLEHSVTNIPNPINTNLFHPLDKTQIRKKLNLPEDKKLLLFSSMKISNPKKGIHYLIEACRILQQQYPEFCQSLGILVMGKEAEQYTNLFPFPFYCLNYVHNEREIANIYNASDLFVTPSLQENLPNTIMEAMACGTPCVGFNIGGIPEMIDHLHNGYVAQYKSAEDLANGIYWSLNDGNYNNLSEEARRKAVTTYSEHIIAMKYIRIYNLITGENA